MLVSLASLLLIPTSGLALDAPASLVPAGVSPGSQFYLIFTTSGLYQASSTNMSTYDNSVNADAQGGSSLPGVSSLTWKTLGATSAVDQCKPFIDLTKPVYTVTKVLVKSTAAAMFSGGGTSLNSKVGVTPSGGSPPTNTAWIGCSNTGSPLVGNELGTANPGIGIPSLTDSFWISVGTSGVGTAQQLYAVSPLLTAPPLPAAVPTLSAWTQLLLALMVMTLIGWHFHRERSNWSVAFLMTENGRFGALSRSEFGLLWRTLLACFMVGCHFETQAAATITFSQVGNDVQASLTGTLSLAGVTADGAGITPNARVRGGGLGANVALGPSASTAATSYSLISGPQAIGCSTNTIDASSGSAGPNGPFGINMSGNRLIVPVGFVSGSNVTASATWAGATISSLGLTSGTYVYTWGVESLTIIIPSGGASCVPTLSVWSQLVLALMAITLFGWHFHRERSY
jgi:hypothetical protein